MKPYTDHRYDQVIEEVMRSGDICVAVDEHLNYIAINKSACSYLKIKPEDLLGKSAIQLYPEIIASKNHRNLLKALSGAHILGELIESRVGGILKTDYRPVIIEKEVKAIILNATIYTQR